MTSSHPFVDHKESIRCSWHNEGGDKAEKESDQL